MPRATHLSQVSLISLGTNMKNPGLHCGPVHLLQNRVLPTLLSPPSKPDRPGFHTWPSPAQPRARTKLVTQLSLESCQQARRQGREFHCRVEVIAIEISYSSANTRKRKACATFALISLVPTMGLPHPREAWHQHTLLRGQSPAAERPPF